MRVWRGCRCQRFHPDRTIIAPALHLEDDECRVMVCAKSHLILDLPQMHESPANRCTKAKGTDLCQLVFERDQLILQSELYGT